MLGIFASTAINPSGADGILFGGGTFFMKQVVAVVGAGIYAFVFTYIMLIVISKITPVKVSKEEEELGVDEVNHGENAYL